MSEDGLLIVFGTAVLLAIVGLFFYWLFNHYELERTKLENELLHPQSTEEIRP